MSLVANIEALMKRKLTAEETAKLADFQSVFKIADDDPIIVVLGMMAMNQMVAEQLPERLKKHAIETIELHRIVLQEQSVLMSKELIATIAGQVRLAGLGVQAAWIRYAGFFAAGLVVGMVVLRMLRLQG